MFWLGDSWSSTFVSKKLSGTIARLNGFLSPLSYFLWSVEPKRRPCRTPFPLGGTVGVFLTGPDQSGIQGIDAGRGVIAPADGLRGAAGRGSEIGGSFHRQHRGPHGARRVG